MKNIIITFILIFISSNYILCQDYILYNKYKEEGKLDSAFICVNDNGFMEDYSNEAFSCTYKGDYEKAKYYYEKAFEKGLTKYEFKLNSKGTDFVKSKQYKKLKREYRKIHHNYKKNHNKKLKRKVRRILLRDQRYRTLLIFDKNFYKQSRLDSINSCELYNIIKQNGHLPSLSEVGEIYNNIFTAVYLHLKPFDAANFATNLLQLYKKGEFSNLREIFDIVDQSSYRTGTIFGISNDTFYIEKKKNLEMNDKYFHKQSFGTIYISNFENNKWTNYIIPVTDINKANEARTKYGFCTLEQVSERNSGYTVYDEDAFIKKWGEFKIRK